MLKTYLFLPLVALLFIACSTNQPQYVDSRDFVSFGLDNHDIGDIIKKQVDSLLKQKNNQKSKRSANPNYRRD